MSQSRPLTQLADAERPLYAGVDVGGTNIKLGLVDNLGRPLAKTSIPTHEQTGPEDAMRRATESLRGMAADMGLVLGDLAAVGLVTPGPMDIEAGKTREPHNLPHWHNFPMRDQLRQECGLSVSFANDAGAAAYGEYWVGSGQAFASIVMLTLGTGLGGGIIVDGKSIDGANSHGGECGHLIIDCGPEARLCGCGKRGHLEAYTSAPNVVKRTEEALAAGGESTLSGRIAAGERLTPLMLAEEAAGGDRLSLELVLDTAMYLGVGVVTLLHVIDPNAVILGGAMTFGGHETQLGRRFLDRVRQEVRQRALPTLVERTVVDFASLGNDAGFIGAAGIARAAHQDGGAT